jgi:mRNA interferase HigB
VCVRIIKESYLKRKAIEYPKAANYLASWVAVVRAATWTNITELRTAYPSADMVQVDNGGRVFVFNVCGNTYRLIVAIHFNRQMVFTLRFLTHAEYSKDNWKAEL